MQTLTEQILYMKKPDANKTARKLEETYYTLKEMTTPQTQIPDPDDETLTAKEFNEQLKQHNKEWKINQAYTDLWLATSDIWIYKRRSYKMGTAIYNAIEQAKALGLNIY